MLPKAAFPLTRLNGKFPAARAIARDRPRGHLIASMESQPIRNHEQRIATLTLGQVSDCFPYIFAAGGY